LIWIVGATALAAGLLVGLTGIGGVLLVPVLTGVAGLPLERAVAACMLGFLFSGLYSAFIHLRRARLPLRPVAALCLAAAAGAALGAATLDLLPGTGVLGGMIVGTVLGVFFVPLFFVVVQRVFKRRSTT